MIIRSLFLFLVIYLGAISTVLAQSGSDSSQTTYVYTGIGLGTLLAVLASWSRNHSVLWAIIHAFFGWIYVIYYVLTGGSKS